MPTAKCGEIVGWMSAFAFGCVPIRTRREGRLSSLHVVDAENANDFALKHQTTANPALPTLTNTPRAESRPQAAAQRPTAPRAGAPRCRASQNRWNMPRHKLPAKTGVSAPPRSGAARLSFTVSCPLASCFADTLREAPAPAKSAAAEAASPPNEKPRLSGRGFADLTRWPWPDVCAHADRGSACAGGWRSASPRPVRHRRYRQSPVPAT